jgi:hypothetical protein
MTKGAGRVKAPRKVSCTYSSTALLALTQQRPSQHVQPLDDTLQRVEEAVAQIQQHQASQLSFEAVYRNSYNLVLHKQVRPECFTSSCCRYKAHPLRS